ncbi:MAG TPA: SUMF1/EgtB/PvdO family nonheme iron enzyme [Kiritimatiellia bacterium]|nr:SUMF1/EgtB/PvdO family nonheme iron enzyme [Kiritimatiellia bacterium]
MAITLSVDVIERSFPRGGLIRLLALWVMDGAATAQTLPAMPRAADWAPVEQKTPAYGFVPLIGKASPGPPALALVPGGSYWMGNFFTNLYPAEGDAKELPVHEVPVSTFFIGRVEVTNLEMAETLQWACSNGLVTVAQTVTTNGVTNLYGTVRNTEGTQRELVDLDGFGCQVAFTNGAFAAAAGQTNFPCIRISWHGALAYCNFLSYGHGLPRAVDFGPAEWDIDITSAGYRLPMEAEWEKACRRGTPGTHYPWADDSVQGTNFYMYSIDPMKANNTDGRYGSLPNHSVHPWFSEVVRTTPEG